MNAFLFNAIFVTKCGKPIRFSADKCSNSIINLFFFFKIYFFVEYIYIFEGQGGEVYFNMAYTIWLRLNSFKAEVSVWDKNK